MHAPQSYCNMDEQRRAKQTCGNACPDVSTVCNTLPESSKCVWVGRTLECWKKKAKRRKQIWSAFNIAHEHIQMVDALISDHWRIMLAEVAAIVGFSCEFAQHIEHVDLVYRNDWCLESRAHVVSWATKNIFFFRRDEEPRRTLKEIHRWAGKTTLSKIGNKVISRNFRYHYIYDGIYLRWSNG